MDWAVLRDLVSLHWRGALGVPFGSASFDDVSMLHLGVNIEANDALLAQVARVMKPAARVDAYDAIQVEEGLFSSPAPSACDESFS